MAVPSVTQLEVWKKLQEHRKAMESFHLRDAFAKDPNRFEKFSISFQNDILFDYSKNLVTEETLQLLLELARECNIAGWTKKMFSGEKINITEDRAVLHVALRNRANTPIYVDGRNVMED